MEHNYTRYKGRNKMTITLADAERMIQVAKAKAEEMGIRLTIAVVDKHGDLVALSRMDGAPWRSLNISQGKAFASVEFGVPSGELTERSNTPVMRALMEIRKGLFVPQQGAVPIKQGEKLLGAIGVSGASSEDDEVVALAAVDAF